MIPMALSINQLLLHQCIRHSTASSDNNDQGLEHWTFFLFVTMIKLSIGNIQNKCLLSFSLC